MKYIIIGLLVAGVFLFGGWYCFSTADRLTGIPVRGGAALLDIQPGTTVLAYGGVYAGPRDGLVVYVNETEHCSTSTTTDANGKVSTSTSCSWRETGRTTPTFDLIIVEGASQTPIHISTVDYRLTGNSRYISTGYRTRLRGFANGDGVTVLGTATPNGIATSEVYGGTPQQYIGSYRTWGWVWAVLAGVSVVVGCVAAWKEAS